MPSATELSLNTSALNTGIYGKQITVKRIKNIAFVPIGTRLTTLTTPKATLKALIQHTDPAQRWYVLPVVVGETTDSSTDTKMVEWAYGFKTSLYYGTPVLTFHTNSTLLGVFEVLQQMNGKQNSYEAYLIDDDDQLISTKFINDSGATEYAPFALSNIFTHGYKFDTGEGTKPGIELTFANPKQFNNSNLLVWQLGFDFQQLQPMNTLTLSQVTAVNSSREVDVKVSCGDINFGDSRYGSLLAVVGAWKGTKDSDGSALTVSSVSKVVVGGETAYRITYGSSGFPSASATLTVNLADSDDLAALSDPLEGFESGGGLSQTAV